MLRVILLRFCPVPSDSGFCSLPNLTKDTILAQRYAWVSSSVMGFKSRAFVCVCWRKQLGIHGIDVKREAWALM